ncbi:amidohydrolase family protein [Xylophilus sp. GOD-11R]|uniref:amidohydrolase family protein n=1 Tax=Xylophilus sp. GOD-11R TaxID=3089814 RepID=UPI00298C9837|nr:amidohydrolase family protein [Xylophilus sp. GOD-11R]WPB55312.1 amidohydrolase family protein [Xylophilus sp. GOD-11R]
MPGAETAFHPTVKAVDCHAHVFERGLPLAARRRHAPAFDALLDDYLALLDTHGISHGVLVQPSFLGTDNHYWLDAVARHPGRLRGVAVVDATMPLPALTALKGAGTTGLRLNLVGIEIPDFGSPEWSALLGHIRDLDWHLEIHREARDLPAMLEALRPAGCRLVIDHFGRPDPALGTADPGFQALMTAADSGRVWVKLSAAYRNARSPLAEPSARDATLAAQDAADARTAAAALLGAFGPERLLWGSDWPHTQHGDFTDFARARAMLDDWVSDADQRRRILVDTPAELFGLG